jgi:hypothetical protein
MQTLEMPIAEELEESTQWGDAPPPNIEEQELDLVAFDLWRRGCCLEAASEEDRTGAGEA